MNFTPQPYPLFAYRGTEGPHLVLGWYYGGDNQDVTPTALLEDGQRVNDDDNQGECWTFTHDKADADYWVGDAFKVQARYGKAA